MSNTVEITDTKYIRDIHSKAVLNTDKNGLQDYLIKREAVRKQMQEQQEIKARLNTVEKDMKEIKTMLQELLLRNVNGN